MANNNQINNEYLNNYSNNGTIYSATSIDLSTNQQITEKNVTLLDYDNPILKNGAQISADGYDAYSPLELNKVCRFGLTVFSKIFDFVKNV